MPTGRETGEWGQMEIRYGPQASQESYGGTEVCAILTLPHPFPRLKAAQCPTHINGAHIGGDHRKLDPPETKAGNGIRVGQSPLKLSPLGLRLTPA